MSKSHLGQHPPRLFDLALICGPLLLPEKVKRFSTKQIDLHATSLNYICTIDLQKNCLEMVSKIVEAIIFQSGKKKKKVPQGFLHFFCFYFTPWNSFQIWIFLFISYWSWNQSFPSQLSPNIASMEKVPLLFTIGKF